MTQTAILALEDGTVFEGISAGAPGLSVGEVVFNTAITGYQEILTDPSYARQLVTLTYPHIGNTGCTSQDDESGQVFAAGLIVRDVPRRPSSWRSQVALPEWLKARGVVAISDIDTRKLTRLLRDRGAQNGALMAGDIDADQAIEAARKFPGLKGMDLAKEVCTEKRYDWTEGQLDLDSNKFVVADAALPRGGLRLRREAQHPAHARRARLQGYRGAGADQRRRGAGAASRTACSCPMARAIRRPAITRSPRSRNSIAAQDPDFRHLPRPPAAGAGHRRATR